MPEDQKNNNEVQPQATTKGLPGDNPDNLLSSDAAKSEAPTTQTPVVASPAAVKETGIVQFRQTGGTPTLADIKGVSPGLPMPKNGPLAEFIRESTAAGFPDTYGLAVGIYTICAILAPRCTHTLLGKELRLSASILLAGDECSVSQYIRNICHDYLEDLQPNIVDRITAVQRLSGLKSLEAEEQLPVVDTSDAIDTVKWMSAAKNCIAPHDLLDQLHLNRVLKASIRPRDLPPASLSILAGTYLSAVTRGTNSMPQLFNDMLVIPSLGGATSTTNTKSGSYDTLLARLEEFTSLAGVNEVQLSMNSNATSSWSSWKSKIQQSITLRQSLANEDSAWYQRMRGAPHHLLAIAAAHAANRQIGEGKDFSGSIQKGDIDYASQFLNKLFEV